MNNDEVVLSPCVGICALDEKDICIGCMRSADEILDWGIMSNEQKRLVLKNIALRLEVDQK